MIELLPLDDTEPAFEGSPLLKGALLTLEYIETNGPIGLTPSKALKRYFVEWAAEAFAWPQYTAEELYYLNKGRCQSDAKRSLPVKPPLTRAAPQAMRFCHSARATERRSL